MDPCRKPSDGLITTGLYTCLINKRSCSQPEVSPGNWNHDLPGDTSASIGKHKTLIRPTGTAAGGDDSLFEEAGLGIHTFTLT